MYYYHFMIIFVFNLNLSLDRAHQDLHFLRLPSRTLESIFLNLRQILRFSVEFCFCNTFYPPEGTFLEHSHTVETNNIWLAWERKYFSPKFYTCHIIAVISVFDGNTFLQKFESVLKLFFFPRSKHCQKEITKLNGICIC